MKSTIFTIVTIAFYCFLLTVSPVKCRSRRSHHHNHQKHNQNDALPWRQSDDNGDIHLENESGHEYHSSSHIRKLKHQTMEESDEDSDEGDNGRHAYVMTTDHLKSSIPEDEDQTLAQAFQKHMKPTNQLLVSPHDIYAYKLPSDLWFIVRYKKNSEGRVEKYMNVASSFTDYLDKLDTSTKSVSVNVKGVETVFRLTSKSKSEN